jgi:hypothetical protein
MSAVNLGSIDLLKYGWIHLLHAVVLPAIVKEESVSIDLFKYGWIHLQTAMVKDDRVSRQSGIDLFRYGWIHLPAAIVNKSSVSY